MEPPALKKRCHFEFEPLIWSAAFILSNLRGTVLWNVLIQRLHIAAMPWVEVLIWIGLSGMAVQSLARGRLAAEYIRTWKRNWVLMVFIGVAFASLLWSVSPTATLYRSAALLFSSLIGAHVGTRYSLQGMLHRLFRFGTLVLIVCFALALFMPVVGRMDWEPYNGAWRGIFWNKNQLGSISALFDLVFLILGLEELGKKDRKPARYFVFYLFALVVTYFTKSVAGYFLAIGMTLLTLLAFFWLHMRPRLRSVHYYTALGLGVLAGAFLIAHLGFVLSLFNRDISLTGRIPLWEYLIHDVVAGSLWLGYGFGAIWTLQSFRLSTQQALGWGFPVSIGDNGFLDILLHVGILGLIPFLGVLISLLARSIRYIWGRDSLIDFFPLLLALFAILANVSFSLFLETETFLWILMIAALFIATRTPKPIEAS